MANATVYLKCDRNVEVQSEDVFLTDVGSLRCADPVISAKLKALKVHHFGKDEPVTGSDSIVLNRAQLFMLE